MRQRVTSPSTLYLTLVEPTGPATPVPSLPASFAFLSLSLLQCDDLFSSLLQFSPFYPTRFGYSWMEEERRARLERRVDRDGGRDYYSSIHSAFHPVSVVTLSSPRSTPPHRSTSSLPRLYDSCLPASLPACACPSTLPLAYSLQV